jgi:hypothetical protein
MVSTSIATAARTAGAAVLAAAAALRLATGMTMGPAMDTAQAAPHPPNPPNSWGTLYGEPEAAAPFWRYQQYDDDLSRGSGGLGARASRVRSRCSHRMRGSTAPPSYALPMQPPRIRTKPAIRLLCVLLGRRGRSAR